MTRVLVTSPLPGFDPAAFVDAGVDVDQWPSEDPMPPEELKTKLSGAEAAITMITDKVDVSVLEAASSLRVIANYGAGYDNVHLATARSRNVVVTNTPVNHEPTAELAWTLLMAAGRRVREGEMLARSGSWRGWRPSQLLGVPFFGTTLLVIGLGRVGEQVARMGALGFGMRVLYVARSPKPEIQAELGLTRVALDEGLVEADHVVVTASLNDDTFHMINAAALSRMKNSAVLVNVGRGPIVDESALVDALQQRKIFAAGLDVYEREPEISDALVALDNAILLPHLGSATNKTRVAMTQLCCENVLAVLSERPALTPVQ